MHRRTFLQGVPLFAAATAAVSRKRTFAAPLTPRIKIAQIGTGHSHAGKLASARSLVDTYEVVGIAEPDESLWAVASKSPTYAGLPRMSVDELLAVPGLQAVTVETKMEHACATAERCIAAGKHIHLDKPGSFDHTTFRTMRLNAERRGLTVQMGFMLRYNPAFELLFRAVREGWLGEILEIDAMMGKLANKDKHDELATIAGGGLFELGCHLVDAVVTVMGKPERVEAFSTPRKTGTGEPKDNQLAVFQYPKATATIRCNHADPFGAPRRRFQIAGTKGALEIMPLESGKCRLMLSETHGDYKKGDQVFQLDVPNDRYIGDFIDLAKVLRGEKKLAWTAEHDINVHETALRASGAWTG